MYKDLKRSYWWVNMKHQVAEFVARCLTCQRVKAEHQRPSGLLQPLRIPKWKWEHITMDFVTDLPRTRGGHDAIWVVVERLTKSAHFLPIKKIDSLQKLAQIYQASIKMVPYETLYGRKCRSPIHWEEVGERRVLVPKNLERKVGVVTKIRERIKAAQDRQKSYADNTRKDLRFEVGDKVFFKIAPMKGVIRFG
ncbi:hypothetical protein DH2020_003914 [Rehmannia glutinosa]|uniref:Integrase zinc-binding domain-containing protein n=1 Tax=Rehmannia glutinosa TaxID=99300 RepID=A0ABR0XMY2_REHGL